MENKERRYVIFEFSNPTNIKITSAESMWGRKFKYMSHVEQSNAEDIESNSTFFQHDNKMMYQNIKGEVCQSTFRIHENVRVLAIIISGDSTELKSESLENMVYGSQTQKFLQKQYLSVISPEKHQVKQSIQKQNDRERYQTEKRKELH